MRSLGPLQTTFECGPDRIQRFHLGLGAEVFLRIIHRKNNVRITQAI